MCRQLGLYAGEYLIYNQKDKQQLELLPCLKHGLHKGQERLVGGEDKWWEEMELHMIDTLWKQSLT